LFSLCVPTKQSAVEEPQTPISTWRSGTRNFLLTVRTPQLDRTFQTVREANGEVFGTPPAPLCGKCSSSPGPEFRWTHDAAGTVEIFDRWPDYIHSKGLR
jgi:hypothetical protein